MFKRRILYLTLCFLGSIISIGLLAIISDLAGKSPNHFIRQTPGHVVEGVKFIDLKKRGYYFAGLDSSYAYLVNQIINNKILTVNISQGIFLEEIINAPKDLMISSSAYLSVEDRCPILWDGMKSEIWRGDGNHLFLKYKDKVSSFTKGILLSPASYIFLSINKKNENDLIKQERGGRQKTGKGLLQKQIDGLFCTDGQLIKVPNSNRIFYTYFYRNQFMCADTNLNLLYRGKTIDTNSYAKIKVAKIRSTNQLTLASPPKIINKHTDVNEKYLFIHSGLKADNETDKVHEESAVIDVYNVKDGKYKLSFYLPNFDGKSLNDFKVYGQSLYALYDHYLYKYQLNF